MRLLRLRTPAVFATLLSLLVAAGAERPAPLRVFVCAHSFMIFTSRLLPSMAQVKALNQSIGRETVRIVPVMDAVFSLRDRIVKGEARGLTKQTERRPRPGL